MNRDSGFYDVPRVAPTYENYDGTCSRVTALESRVSTLVRETTSLRDTVMRLQNEICKLREHRQTNNDTDVKSSVAVVAKKPTTTTNRDNAFRALIEQLRNGKRSLRRVDGVSLKG